MSLNQTAVGTKINPFKEHLTQCEELVLPFRGNKDSLTILTIFSTDQITSAVDCQLLPWDMFGTSNSKFSLQRV